MAKVYEIKSFRGGLSDYEDKGIAGAFKMGKNLNIRKPVDSLTCNQALVDEGLNEYSQSPSASTSPSASVSPSLSASVTRSPSASISPSSSVSGSQSASSGISPSVSLSPSASASPSASVSPSSSVSPSPSSSGGLTTIFRDLIKWFVEASDGHTYGFGDTGWIYRRDSSGRWVTVYKDANGEIKGAYEWCDNTGTRYMFWATDNHLKKKPLPGLANWNDVTVIAGNLSSADSHMMREAGGSLIIANGSYLALVGYDGSYTPQALDLIPGHTAKTIVERNGRTIIGTFNPAAPEKGSNAAIDCEYPLAQVGDDGQIVFANMSDTIPVKRFPGGGKVNPGGVANEEEEVMFFEWEQNALSWIDKQAVGNLSLWGVYDATAGYNGIYSFGRKNKNQPFVMNMEYELEVDEIGAVTVVNGTVLASYKDGTDYGVKAESSTTKATGVYEGFDFKSPLKQPERATLFTKVELLLTPLPYGTSVEFWYKMNKTGDFVRAQTPDEGTSYSILNGRKVTFLIGAEGEIYEPRVVLNPFGNYSPEVHAIRTFFD